MRRKSEEETKLRHIIQYDFAFLSQVLVVAKLTSSPNTVDTTTEMDGIWTRHVQLMLKLTLLFLKCPLSLI